MVTTKKVGISAGKRRASRPVAAASTPVTTSRCPENHGLKVGRAVAFDAGAAEVPALKAGSTEDFPVGSGLAAVRRMMSSVKMPVSIVMALPASAMIRGEGHAAPSCAAWRIAAHLDCVVGANNGKSYFYEYVGMVQHIPSFVLRGLCSAGRDAVPAPRRAH